MDATQIALRIAAALLLGALVGIERERKRRPAGFRTMILVSLGSAAFMLIAQELVLVPAGRLHPADPDNPATTLLASSEISRVLQGLIGGVGFLGAGAVIQNKRSVRGLTTAAAIWVTAAIGAACGLGFFVVAAIVSVATLFTLIILELVETRFFPDAIQDDTTPSIPPPPPTN